MVTYKFTDNKGNEYTAELEDDYTANLFAEEMGMILVGKVE